MIIFSIINVLLGEDGSGRCRNAESKKEKKKKLEKRRRERKKKKRACRKQAISQQDLNTHWNANGQKENSR